MFECDEKLKKQIASYNEAIKSLVKENREILSSDFYNYGSQFIKLKKQGLLKTTKNRISLVFDEDFKKKRQYDSKYHILHSENSGRSTSNYFCNERIAVYTCIIGNYDGLLEPYIKPDNIDYYIVTDADISDDSLWKKIDINKFEQVKNFSNVAKCRYVKTHPHLFFNEYKYSIYVDGNFKIYTDLTEHVNRIGLYGLSAFKHCQRECVYDEFEACKLLNKGNIESINNYCEKLISSGMPKKYGLLETGMLVREHNSNKCVSLMEDWWAEMSNNLFRDQLTLPYVLYKNKVEIGDIATLGVNIRNDYSFEVLDHSNK